MTLKQRRGYISSPYGQLHYRDAGDANHTAAIVLLHQTAWSGLQWRGVQLLLAARGIRSIAPDTPGYGMSDGPERPPTIDDYAAAIAPLVDELGLTRVLIAGHHTGSSIGAALANRLPGRVAGLIMHAPSIYTPEEAQTLLGYPHWDQSLKQDGSHWTARWDFARKATGGKARLDATQLSVMMFFTTGAHEWFGHHAVFNFDLAAALKKVDVPTLVISNTGDMTHEKVARTLELRPDFTYAELEGGTVYIVYEEPERWSAPLIEFAGKHLPG
jgi:pimeloyl-ACP methyl ester carboxylesterase